MKHEISLSMAIDMTQRYRSEKPANAPICESFELASIQRLLATPGAAFLRIYYGQKENGELDAILVAADASGNDLLPVEETEIIENSNNDGPLILEDSFRCPPTCPPGSPLNED